MFRPKSVAILGASTNENKIGGRPVRYLKHYKFDGPIYPVNPNAAEVQGLTAYKSILDVAGEVDLALIVLPATAVCRQPAYVPRKASNRWLSSAQALLKPAMKVTQRS